MPTVCFIARWLEVMPQRPRRNIATAAATAMLFASIVAADAPRTRSDRFGIVTSAATPIPRTRMNVQKTMRKTRVPTRGVELVARPISGGTKVRRS